MITFLTNYWEHTAKKNAAALRDYLHSDVAIYLHDTNETLDFNGWIEMTENYPVDGEWKTTVDRVDKLENGQVVTITFHRSAGWIGFVTSFFTLKDDKIVELHEYYSPCDAIPQWRTDLSEDEKIK